MNRSPNSPGAVQTPPPPFELSGGLPRDVRLTGAGVAAAVAAIAMVVGAVSSVIIMSVAYARAEQHPEGSFPLWAIPLGFAGLMSGAAAVAGSVRRQYVLLSEGRVATARITGLEKFRAGRHGADRRYRVSCEFQTLSGARRTFRCEVGKNPGATGTSTAIVYHRDDPEWSALYPLPLVRLSRARPPR